MIWTVEKTATGVPYLKKNGYTKGPISSALGSDEDGVIYFHFSDSVQKVHFSELQNNFGTGSASAFVEYLIENDYLKLGGEGGGNGFYVDYRISAYTSASPFILNTVNTPIKLTFDKDNDTSFISRGKLTPENFDFWDNTEQKIKSLQPGLGYLFTIGFKFDVTQNDRYVKVFLQGNENPGFGTFRVAENAGSAGRTTSGNPEYRTKFFYVGNQIVADNGFEIYFESDRANTAVYDIGIIVSKV